MTRQANRYPSSAYAPNGELWWKLDKDPAANRRFGDERKIAAWLAFNVHEGETFTMRDLRRALGAGEETPNAAEHLNRRLRNLRDDGWVVFSYRDDGTLPVDGYRLQRTGWHPAQGPRSRSNRTVSAGVRRRVLDRDGRRCVVCGVGNGEPYPESPARLAVMTIGHRIPGNRSDQPATADELQTECQRCNETVRDEIPDPLRVAEVLPDVKRLNRAEQRLLLTWLEAGRRTRSRVDEVHDRVRTLSPQDRDLIATEVRRMLGNG